MKNALAGLAAVLVVAATAHGTLTYSTPLLSSAPEGDASLDTYLLVLSDDNGNVLAGFVVAIAGPVHQNPFGGIFANDGPPRVPPGSPLLDDTQFPYFRNVEVAAGADCYENAGLGGSWAFLGGVSSALAGPSVTVAQVCLADGAWVPFAVTAVEYDGQGSPVAMVYIEGVIPEPVTVGLLALGGMVLLGRWRS